MPINIRPRGKRGTAFELRITPRLLPKPIFRTCSSQEEAGQVGALAIRSLDLGVVPDWLIRPREKAPTISNAIVHTCR